MGRKHAERLAAATGVAVAALLAGSHVAAGDPPDRFGGMVRGEVFHRHVDGVTDDLLSAGLGADGLLEPAPPDFADPLDPTPEDIRRRTIHTNYRALVDMAPAGGYATLYGPDVNLDGTPVEGDGLIAGHEYLAVIKGKGVSDDLSAMVQIPDGFSTEAPCIVTAPSSGSRGVYGAIATAGEWGLKKGCAVVHVDKGTGTGGHDLSRDAVHTVRGEHVRADAAAEPVTFEAPLSERGREAFAAGHPDRWAFKHAHSKDNSEQHWGRDVLRSVEFAFAVLDRHFGGGITPESTLVIASSVSNGGGASLRAAELDRRGLIDGVAVSEPNVQPVYDPSFAIRQGDGPDVTAHSRPLLDYTTLLNVYQPCASAAAELSGAPLNLAASPERCAALRERGLLSADDLQAQASEAQAVVNAYGILPEQNFLQPAHHFLYVPQSISVTYANAYGRFGVEDSLCGYGMAAVDANGAPAPLAPAAAEALFAVSNGIPPTGGVQLINERAFPAPAEDRASTPDQNLEGALCLRSLWLGTQPGTGEALSGRDLGHHERVRAGIEKVRAGADLNGKPVVIVHGRADAILPPNHTSRPYYALAAKSGADGASVRYYEVTSAQHLDALNGIAGFDARYIPLHYYYFQALDLMWDHLSTGASLPPSQVVRPVPRGPGAPAAPPITEENLPPIASEPAEADLIRFDGAVLSVPE